MSPRVQMVTADQRTQSQQPPGSTTQHTGRAATLCPFSGWLAGWLVGSPLCRVLKRADEVCQCAPQVLGCKALRAEGSQVRQQRDDRLAAGKINGAWPRREDYFAYTDTSCQQHAQRSLKADNAQTVRDHSALPNLLVLAIPVLEDRLHHLLVPGGQSLAIISNAA
jgi:hypothetical protein